MPHSPITRTDGGSVSTIRSFLLGSVFDGARRKALGRQGGSLNRRNQDAKNGNNISNKKNEYTLNENPHVWSPPCHLSAKRLKPSNISHYASTPNLSVEENAGVKPCAEPYSTLGRPSVKKMVQKLESFGDANSNSINLTPPSLNSSYACLSNITSDTGFQSDCSFHELDCYDGAYVDFDIRTTRSKNLNLPVRANSFHQNNSNYVRPRLSNSESINLPKRQYSQNAYNTIAEENRNSKSTKRHNFVEVISNQSHVHFISDGCCEVKCSSQSSDISKSNICNTYLKDNCVNVNKVDSNTCSRNLNINEFECSTPRDKEIEETPARIISKDDNTIINSNDHLENETISEESEKNECKIVISSNGSFLARWVPVEDL